MHLVDLTALPTNAPLGMVKSHLWHISERPALFFLAAVTVTNRSNVPIWNSADSTDSSANYVQVRLRSNWSNSLRIVEICCTQKHYIIWKIWKTHSWWTEIHGMSSNWILTLHQQIKWQLHIANVSTTPAIVSTAQNMTTAQKTYRAPCRTCFPLVNHPDISELLSHFDDSACDDTKKSLNLAWRNSS